MKRSSAPRRPSQRHRRTSGFRGIARALGLRIRQLRQERDWTLEVAAEHMDLDLKHLQKIEAGQLNVTLVSLSRIAEGLGTSVGELFTTDESRV